MTDIEWLPFIDGYTDYRPVFTPNDRSVIYEHTDVNTKIPILYEYELGSPDPPALFIEHPPNDLKAQTRADVAKSSGMVTLTDNASGSNGYIWLVTPNGGTAKVLTPTFGMCYSAWYADEQRMAVMNTNNKAPYDCAINASGYTIDRLMPDDLYAGMPSVSPVDGRLVFPGQKTGQPYDQRKNVLYLADSKTSAHKLDGDHQGRAPWWSPDGTRIAFESNRSLRGYAIYVISIDTQVIEQITDPSIGAQHPKWSSDGSRIVFAGRPNPDDTRMAIGIVTYKKPDAA